MADNVFDKIAKAKGITTDKVNQWVRDKAIADAVKHLSSVGQTPFDIGEEKFEVLVAEKEKEFTSELKTKALKGLGLIALFLGID